MCCVVIRSGNWNETFRAGPAYLNLNNVRSNSNNNMGVRDLVVDFCLRALVLTKDVFYQGIFADGANLKYLKNSSFCSSKKRNSNYITKINRN